MFINAVGEYSEQDTPIRQACAQFKRMMKRYIRELGEKAGALNPEKLADELALLLEGAIVTAQVSKSDNAAQVAKRTAKILIDQAISSKP